MITDDAVRMFLTGHRIAVVGASDSKESFGRTICQALIDHGYDAVPVHPTATSVAGCTAYPRLADVPEPVDGVIVMVPATAATQVVEDAAAAGIDQVWLFKGIGGPGAVSAEVLAACAAHHIDPVAGACPLMFLEPVELIHRIHRSVRRLRGDVERAAHAHR
jgi:predicted CoA-binding protein